MGRKAVGRWHNGMLGWDAFIPNGEYKNIVVGLITLKDKAGCGRGHALTVCSSLQFEKASYKRLLSLSSSCLMIQYFHCYTH